MRKVILSVVFVLAITSFTHAETLSLTTYYPAPFGVYNQLRLTPTGVNPVCNANNNGLMWINNATWQLMFCYNNGLTSSVATAWTEVSPNVNLTTATNNVGIGVSPPTRKLHVRDVAADVMRVESTAGGAAKVEFAESNVLRSKLAASAANALTVEDNAGATPFGITQTGLVGVGTASPLQQLHVTRTVGNTSLVVSSTAANAFGAIELRANGVGGPFIDFSTGSTSDAGGGTPDFSARIERAGNADGALTFTQTGSGPFVFNGGNVGIGTIPAPLPVSLDPLTRIPQLTVGSGAGGPTWVRNDLYVSTIGVGGSGNVTAHAFFYVSDENLKENIKPVSGLDTIMRLKGVKFNWKASGEADIGVLAQDVEKVLPELVNSNVNMKTVKMGNLVAPLIEAIKEQQLEIEELRKEIEALKLKQF